MHIAFNLPGDNIKGEINFKEKTMKKAILKSTGIKLDVIGESGSRATEYGLKKEYRVKKETASAICSFRVTEDQIIFV